MGEKSSLDWKGVLSSIVETHHLTGKNTACPLCGGVDRFRYTNYKGRGEWICSKCGAGDGYSLIMKKKGVNFNQAKKMAGQVMETTPIKKDYSQVLRKMWKSAKPITKGDPVDQYLTNRNLGMDIYPNCLRYAVTVTEGKQYDTMIALVEGNTASLHRTFIKDGQKADVGKKMMPGAFPIGGAIRLSSYDKCLGIAEGIETALSASKKFGVPVWSATSAPMLEKWQPPNVDKLIIFGDNDKTFTGQKAAYNLAYRLHDRIKVEVKIPDEPGTDWADL